jgi:uncharacterized lipoprotein YmbA
MKKVHGDVAAARAASASGLALALIVAGCASSAPLRYYMLSDVPPTTGPAAGPSDAIRVGRVRIPGELDRSEVVQRIDANRLKIAEQDRWAAPLDEMIRRVLAADLQLRASASSNAPAAAARAAPAASSAATSSATPAAPSTSAATSTLSVDIDEFIGDATCAVTLRASWELKPAGANAAPAGGGIESIQIAAPSSATCAVGALPAAMSQALAQLSERILAATR